MKKLINFMLLGMALIISAQPYAATVTVFGDDVSFTYDNATLFGTANVIGNSIFFLPTTFKAESLNGAGAVTTNETLNIIVEAITQGYEIEEFLLVESGDYKLSGNDASASVNGLLAVTSLTTLAPPFNIFPFREEQFFDAGNLTDTGGAPAAWTATAGIDLGTIAGWGSDTRVTATIENLLTATTLNNGEIAFVEKKFGGIGLTVNPVPVPAAVWLFGSALFGLLGLRRASKTV